MNVCLTHVLAEYVSNLRFSDLSKEAVDSAKLSILDYFISSIAGYKINRSFNDAVYSVLEEVGGKEESSIIFYNKKVPSLNAALLNGVIGHGSDIDDGHRMAQGHPAVAIVPAVIALAEAYGKSGKDIITAVVAGYDIFVRLSMAINPYHTLQGFHPTGTVGTIAAAAAASNLLRLSVSETETALSFACMQAAGLFEIIESGQCAKGLNPGKAASNGVFSVLLAKSGAESPTNVLEGKKGFFNGFGKDVNVNEIIKDLGKKFEITTCYIKLYPACRHTHGAIDASYILKKDKKVHNDSIEKINIYTYLSATKIVGNIDIPRNEDDAKFSMKYIFAVALEYGDFKLEHLNVADTINNNIRELIGKTAILYDDTLESRAKGIRGTRVEIILKDGSSETVTIELPKGDLEVPVTLADMRKKLGMCAEGIFDKESQDNIFDYLSNFDNIDNICPVFDHFIK